jgi:putative drug exporter of the RND superfamily
VLISSSPGQTGRGHFPSTAARSSLERWTLFVLRHRWAVLGSWLVVLVAGVWASIVLPRHLVDSFGTPGTESDRAASALARGFGERPEGTFTVVFRLHGGPTPQVVTKLRRRLERGARVVPGGRLGAFRAGPGTVYGEIETALGLQQAKDFTEPLRRALREDGAPLALVTGQPAVQHDLEPQLAADLRRGEAVALPLALVVLAFVLGLSAALALPFVFAACTIGGTVALLYLCAQFVAITPYALNVAELIGLGLAVDYSLLVVSRCREQLALGQGRTDAITHTMATAGRAVTLAGITVAIGLALLLSIPVPFIRTMGLAGLLIPLVSVTAAVTLQPVLLSLFPIGPARPVRGDVWRALARRITRRPRRVLAGTAVALLAAAAPALFLELTPGSLAGLPPSMEASRGLVALRHAFGPGAVTPTEVVVDTHQAGGARGPGVQAAVERLVDRLFHDPEVYVVAFGREPPYVSPHERYARVRIVGRHEFGTHASRQLVDRVRASFVPAARFPSGATVSVGGAAPQGVDFLRRSYSSFPWLVLLALALTYIALARAFRSLLLPLKAVLLNLFSVGASYGLLVLIFGTEIEGWIPILLFATLFGLSMDYEVFLVSRMREARDAGHTTADSIALGLERTGRPITVAALVMAASFAGFVVGSVPSLRQFGVGLICGVVIDATLVRALLVPSTMAVLGRWSWWSPRRSLRPRVGVVAGALVLALAAPGTAAAASPTVRLAIAHVVQHCHVWRTSTKLLGASAKLTVKPGTRLLIRADCPMDFDYVQKGGPKLALGSRRTFAGDNRVIVFRKAGTYRLQATNVQTPEERGLVTLGATNTLTLTVVVK